MGWGYIPQLFGQPRPFVGKRPFLGKAIGHLQMVFVKVGSGKNLGRYAASWTACWPKRPSSTAALT